MCCGIVATLLAPLIALAAIALWLSPLTQDGVDDGDDRAGWSRIARVTVRLAAAIAVLGMLQAPGFASGFAAAVCLTALVYGLWRDARRPPG